jgi:hypothetical protein
MATVESMTHDQLVAWCVEFLNRRRGSYAYETHGGWRNKPKVPGIFDVANIRDGRSHYYEIKIGKDRVRPDQLEFRDRVRRAGGHAAIVRSPEDLVSIVTEEDRYHAG